MPKNNSLLDDLADLNNQAPQPSNRLYHRIKWHFIHLFLCMTMLLGVVVLSSFFPYSGIVALFSVLIITVGALVLLVFVCHKSLGWKLLPSLLNGSLIFFICFFCVAAQADGSILQYIKSLGSIKVLDSPLLKDAVAAVFSYCFLVSIAMEFNNFFGLLIQKKIANEN